MNKRQAKRLPLFTTDDGGQPIAIVPLANGRTAMIDRGNWEALLCAGLTPHWTCNDNGTGCAYVRAHGRDNTVTIARVITGAGRGRIVRHRNGDRTDLRRSNLYVLGAATPKGSPTSPNQARQLRVRGIAEVSNGHLRSANCHDSS